MISSAAGMMKPGLGLIQFIATSSDVSTTQDHDGPNFSLSFTDSSLLMIVRFPTLANPVITILEVSGRVLMYSSRSWQLFVAEIAIVGAIVDNSLIHPYAASRGTRSILLSIKVSFEDTDDSYVVYLVEIGLLASSTMNTCEQSDDSWIRSK